ncbi:hypothetical protein JZ751_020022 [Albula glossodonta]|uniref:VWFA domain-containing protein n=1 Tax=Albula glossodonta TaxID=121402 RepID=A0A8T2NNN6_9TELE|nr:hypothetical protein JZ751_020022 [Albula glossodonta]
MEKKEKSVNQENEAPVDLLVMMDIKGPRETKDCQDLLVLLVTKGNQGWRGVLETLVMLDQGGILAHLDPREIRGTKGLQDHVEAGETMGLKASLGLKEILVTQVSRDIQGSQDQEASREGQGEPGEPGDPGLTECDVMTYTREICGCCDCEKLCGALDIVFVIDSSESVGLTNFTLEKNFIISTINHLGSIAKDPSSETGIRVGVVQYSHSGAFQAIKLNDPKIDSMAALKDAVKRLEWIAGGSWTPSAIKFTYDNLVNGHHRAKAKITTVVITDGRYDPRDNDTQLISLCSKNIEVNAIGIGDMFNQQVHNQTIWSIVCNVSSRIMIMRHFADLMADEFVKKIQDMLCPEMVVAECNNRPVDLVFLLDGSERLGEKNFHLALKFVKSVVDREELNLTQTNNEEMNARVALLLYGNENDQRVAFNFTYNLELNTDNLKNMSYIDESSDVGVAIIYAINNIITKGDQRLVRDNAELSFVFITDGLMATNHLDEAVSAMRRVEGVPTVIAMGSDVDEEVLTKIVKGEQSAIFRGPDFSHLSKPSFFERFIRWIC